MNAEQEKMIDEFFNSYKTRPGDRITGIYIKRETFALVVNRILAASSVKGAPRMDMREYLRTAELCPYCPNVGWYESRDGGGQPIQIQCEWCETNPKSIFRRLIEVREGYSPPGPQPVSKTGGASTTTETFTQPGEEKYACDRCGKLRTKEEGGTTFTVCDECWSGPDKTMPPPQASTGEDVEHYINHAQRTQDGSLILTEDDVRALASRPVTPASTVESCWECTECGKVPVPPREVTFEEYHEGCGGKCVIREPKPQPEGGVEREAEEYADKKWGDRAGSSWWQEAYLGYLAGNKAAHEGLGCRYEDGYEDGTKKTEMIIELSKQLGMMKSDIEAREREAHDIIVAVEHFIRNERTPMPLPILERIAGYLTHSGETQGKEGG